jgi:hypothetical protein
MTMCWDFSLAYAHKTELDHTALVEAVRSGRLEALVEEELCPARTI